MKYQNALNVELLKFPLSRETYTEKFHHLLCWEEQEHDNILKERYYNAVYSQIFLPFLLRACMFSWVTL